MLTPYESLLQTEEGRVALAEEHAIAHVAELICQLMEKSGITRTDLASKMKVSAGRVTQILDGEANLTLATVARALLACGHVFECTSRPLEEFCHPPIFKYHNTGWQTMTNNNHSTHGVAPEIGAASLKSAAV
jgi:hypothetical protein